MEKIRESNERIKLSHQKRVDSTKLAFSNLSAKLKNSKSKQNPDLVKQWSTQNKQFDSSKLSAFTSKDFKMHDFKMQKKPKQKVLSEKFYSLELDISNVVKVRMYDEKRKMQFSADLGQAVPPHTEFDVRREPEKYTVEYFGYGVLTISYLQLGESDFYEVLWVMEDNVQLPLQDTIHLKPSHWFRGSISPKQTWPSSGKHKLCPFVPWDTATDPGNGYGSVLERYWLSASGIGLYVDAEVPLYVSEDFDAKKELTLVAMYDKPYKNVFDHKLFLTYAILHSPDMMVTHDIIREELFFKSEGRPSVDLFRLPIFTVKASKPELTLQDHVNLLKDYSIGPCIIELVDWTAHHGDMAFNPKRFPDVKNMITSAKDQGYKTILRVHPFASPMSRAFYEGDHLWVKSAMVEGVTSWKRSPAKLLDLTSPEARAWLKNKLLDLQEEFDLDGFSFDFGQVNYLPPLCNTFEQMSNPSAFTRSYLELAKDITFPRSFGIVRSGSGTHNVPLIIRMEEKNSTWGWDNGLKTVIPSALTLGLMGYRYILPGTVGGGGGGGSSHRGSRPCAELYVRWLETVLLMPGLAFSRPPWEYGDETLGLVHKLLALRGRYVGERSERRRGGDEGEGETVLLMPGLAFSRPAWEYGDETLGLVHKLLALRGSLQEYLEAVAEEAEAWGAPMVRPLWWWAPRDSIAHTIDSQFLLGENLMVAPVQERGVQHRAIYLPPGTWRDGLRGNTLQGGCWLYSYRARLGELPHFTLIDKGPKEGMD